MQHRPHVREDVGRSGRSAKPRALHPELERDPTVRVWHLADLVLQGLVGHRVSLKSTVRRDLPQFRWHLSLVVCPTSESTAPCWIARNYCGIGTSFGSRVSKPPCSPASTSASRGKNPSPSMVLRCLPGESATPGLTTASREPAASAPLWENPRA